MLKIAILLNIAPKFVSITFRSQSAQKLVLICADNIQTPVAGKVCLEKILISATKNVCVDKTRGALGLETVSKLESKLINS